MKKDKTDRNVEERLIRLLEKQKQELVIRTLQKHEEIKGEKAFTDKVIANLSDILIILNSRMQIIKVNKEFTKCLGHEIDGRKKLSLRELLSPDGFRRLIELIREGEFKNYETELVSVTGRKFLASINGSTVENEKGSRNMHILVARDKTEVYDMMSRVRESQMQVIHSGRLASLGEMAAGIAHELTQPLNAILLFARNSLKSLSDHKTENRLVEENLTYIVDRVKKAGSIIKSLKSFARKTDEEKIFMDINSLIKDILKFLDAQFRLSDVELELDLNEDIAAVLAHNVRLEQVFLNIIQNALQAMGRIDSPRLIIRTYTEERLDPESLKSHDYVVISVADNGEGISPEVKNRIFDPFFTTREVGSGMGLGLSIVDRIIREHSGYISVQSSPGKGACFTVFLPSAHEETTGD
ncbi:MAG: PAS domain-containing protein [Nitrospiraceae bacterium]|nr:MAG: PAS domain-containing protein [Nitrospiraceae bacterium]